MVYKIIFSIFALVSSTFAIQDIKDLQSFKANFIQKIISANDKQIDYEGEVYIKSSGKVLWKYKTPIIKNVYILNDYVIVDEPELEQAIFTTLEDEINILNLLKNAKKVNQNTYMAKIGEIDYLIELSKDKKIEKIRYKDKLDNDVQIKFENIIQNQKIDDEIFKFVQPEGYDIIRK